MEKPCGICEYIIYIFYFSLGSPADYRKEPVASRSPDSTSVQGVTLIDDHLIFSQTKVGSAAMLKLQVQNSSNHTHTVSQDEI